MSRVSTNITSILSISSMASTSLMSSVKAEEMLGMEPNSTIELIHVVGTSIPRAALPGSSTRLSSEDIAKFKYQDVMRLMRQVPGINIQEEDGLGLRPNIGLRGSGVERSGKITLMEDGILIAPAAYAAPSAYYFPTAARMQAVEVRKGSAAIKFGPRTVGGAINFVSHDIPDEFGGFVDSRVGSDSLRTIHGLIGGSNDQFGAMLEYFDSRSDGFKKLSNGDDTGFDIEDVLAKFRWNLSDAHTLNFKLGKTSEISGETYLGTTESDFVTAPNIRYAASQLDQIDADHDMIQVSHSYKGDDLTIVTTLYENKFSRDWFKFDDFYVAGVSTKASTVLNDPVGNSLGLAILKGEVDSDLGALRLKHNARSYRSSGIQTNVKVDFSNHSLEVSARYHEDYEDRLQNRENFTMLNGVMTLASVDALGSAGNRHAHAEAWAFMMQDTIESGAWTLVPGIRYENIDLGREDYLASDYNQNGAAISRRSNSVNAFIPGVGVSYQYSDNLLLTGGVFKGFNPPGTSDQGADVESSINSEFGIVYTGENLNIEIMSYYNDYKNILGSCMESVGCQTGNIGDQFNGGKAEIHGLEVTADYTVDLNGDWRMPLRAVYTYTSAKFASAFVDGFWGDVKRGDHMPYVPEQQLTLSLGVENDDGSIMINANYVSATRAIAGQGSIEDDQKIDGRMIFDASLTYHLSEMVSVFASLQNITDEHYIVARRPYGVRPGKPQSMIVGLRFDF